MESVVILSTNDVPAYLHDSAFYRNLSSDDDGTFSLMNSHFKPDLSLSSESDLDLLLSTLQFWDLDVFPESILFKLLQNGALLSCGIDERYGDVFPILRTIYRINQAKELDKMNVAVQFQSLQLIKCMLDMGIRFDTLSACVAAATGSVSVLQYIHEHGCVLHSIATAHAARHGRLACLQYLHQHECAWHESLGRSAAEGGHLECLIYAIEDNYDPVDTLNMCKFAARNGHAEFFKYLVYHQLYTNVETLQLYAADGGNPRCLKLAHTLSQQWALGVQSPIIQSKNKDCFVYSVMTGCRYNREDIVQMTKLGLVDFLRFLRDHTSNVVFDSYIMHCAVENRQIECVKYFHSQGCAMDTDCRTIALRMGFLPCLQYMHASDTDSPYTTQDCIVATWRGHFECVKFLYEHGAPFDEQICSTAAAHGHISILKYLHEQGCPWDAATTTKALQNKHIACFEYARDHGCPVASHSSCIVS